MQPAWAETLRFSANDFNPFSRSTPSPVETFSGAVKYDVPKQFNTYGSIDFFRVKLDGAVFTPTNATVYLTSEPFFGLPLLDFEGDVANFDPQGNTLHFLLVNEYDYGAALNLGVNGEALEWQPLDVKTKPRNPAPRPIAGTVAAVPEPSSATPMLAGAALLAKTAFRKRSTPIRPAARFGVASWPGRPSAKLRPRVARKPSFQGNVVFATSLDPCGEGAERHLPWRAQSLRVFERVRAVRQNVFDRGA